MYAKLKAGADGYGVLFPSSYLLPLLKKEGLIQQLDPTHLPNLVNVDENFSQLLPDPDMINSVPYMMSYTGIGYLADSPAAPQSWAAFEDETLKGRMTLLDDPRETIGAALKFNGFSLNSIDEGELAVARDTVISWKRNLAKFDNAQYHHGLASGEFKLVQGYSGDVLQARKENEAVRFALPAEGFPMTCDVMVISAKAKSPDLGLRFINFMHDPAVAAQNTKFIRYLCPNKGSYGLLPPELLNDPAIFPPAEVLANAEFIQNLGENNALYTKVWDEIRAAK